jgi:rubrerythrin
MKDFGSLSEREILALAISLEEEDERVYADFAEGLRQDFPASAAVFDGMRAEEASHRRRLIESYRTKFGEHIPLIRRQDVNGFVQRRPVWLVRPLGLDAVRKQASAIHGHAVSAGIQVLVGGALVFLTGVLIGSSRSVSGAR